MFCSLLVCARWCCCCCCLPFFDYYLSHEFHLIWKISNFSSYSPFFVFFTSSWYFRCALLCFGSTGHTLQPTRRSFDTSLGNLVPLPPPSSIQNSSHLILWPVCEYICCWYLLSPTNMKRKHKLVIYGDSKYNFHLFFFILYFFFLFCFFRGRNNRMHDGEEASRASEAHKEDIDCPENKIKNWTWTTNRTTHWVPEMWAISNFSCRIFIFIFCDRRRRRPHHCWVIKKSYSDPEPRNVLMKTKISNNEQRILYIFSESCVLIVH